jgi:hypothetical protein
MTKCKDKKILWAMGITAFCLIVTVVCLVVVFNTDGIQNWRVLVPICIAICGMAVSASILFIVMRCGCKSDT